MEQEQLDALQAAIDHWKDLRSKAQNKLLPSGYTRPLAENCPCCQLVVRRTLGSFNEVPCGAGCPIQAYTGLDACDGTPYYSRPYDTPSYFTNMIGWMSELHAHYITGADGPPVFDDEDDDGFENDEDWYV